MKVSVIVPTYNEESVIGECLVSLAEQSYPKIEIIVVDDGSTDKTLKILSELKISNLKFKILKQNHLGAGAARNLGAENSSGDILVFVDSDMTFDKEFIVKLTQPIRDRKAIGTFSKEEYVLNYDNIWSKCWNINKGLPINRMHPKNYPDKQPVFRAILKDAFMRVGGFEPIGYIDDHTLAEKLGKEAVVAPGAVFYHLNPASITEVYRQARWIGKSEYKRRKIKNEGLMRLVAVIRYSLPFSLVKGIMGAIGGVEEVGVSYLLFKVVYDLGVEISLLRSLFKEQRYR